jgi:hypothetical protein
VRHEQRRQAFLGERVDRVERLGRGARLELDELAGLLEADQGVGKSVRRVAELGCGRVGEKLPLRREEKVDERCRERAECEEQAALEEAPDPTRLDDRRRRRRPCSGSIHRDREYGRARAR